MATILLVDDDALIVKMLIRRLKRAGYQVETARDGREGVEKALQLQPDLMLLDMHMPVMDGYTAARTLRERGYQGRIIALTASAMVEETNKSLDAGCDHFVTKPIGTDFEEQVRTLLET